METHSVIENIDSRMEDLVSDRPAWNDFYTMRKVVEYNLREIWLFNHTGIKIKSR